MSYPHLDWLPAQGAEADSELQSQVWGLLKALFPRADVTERRREMRYPFPYLIHLTPVAEDGLTPCGETMVVVGKHISQRGLGFYHPKPIPYRRAIASLESGHGWVGFLIHLGWCRFTRQGWYEGGGRLPASRRFSPGRLLSGRRQRLVRLWTSPRPRLY